MKKTILTLLLVAMSTGAMAEWVRIGGGDDHDSYVDPTTIRKNGKMVKMWSMNDYRTPKVVQGKAVMSVKALVEYDCANETTLVLSAVTYQQAMGFGNSVTNGSSRGSVEYVVPDSIGETTWKIACGKK